MPDYLHNHKGFSDLIKIVADEKRIEAGLVQKGDKNFHKVQIGRRCLPI